MDLPVPRGVHDREAGEISVRKICHGGQQCVGVPLECHQ